MSGKVEVSAVISASDQATPQLRKVGKSLTDLERFSARVGAAFKRIGGPQLFQQFGRIGSAFGQIGSRLRSFITPLLGLVGLGTGFGMAELVSGMQDYVERVRNLSRTAQVLGTTTERLSGLQYAAERAGISADTFNRAMVRANINLANAARGKGTQLTSLMQKLGISFRDAEGNMRGSVDVLEQFARAVAYQSDPLTKTSMAAALFGAKMGPEMLKLLNQGEEGIQRFVAEAIKAGVIIGPEAVAQAEDYARTQRQLGDLWRSMGLSINQALLPVLQQVLPIFKDLLEENREAIVTALTSAFKALGDALRNINWKETIDSIKEWGKWVNENIGFLGGWKWALRIAAIAFSGLLGPIATLTRAFAGLAYVILTNPFLAAIAAIAIAAYLIYRYWGPIKAFFQQLWRNVVDTFWTQLDEIKQLLLLFVPQPIKDNWEEIKQFFSDLWNEPKATFWRAIAWLGEFVASFIPQPIKDAWAGITQFFSQLLSGDVVGAFQTWITTASNLIAAFIPQPIKDAWSTLTGFFQGLWDDITGIFKSAWDWIASNIIGPMRSAIEWVASSWVGRQIGAVGGAVGSAAQSVQQYVAGAAPAQPFSWAQYAGQQQQTLPQQQAGLQRPIEADVGGEIKLHILGLPPGTSVDTTSMMPVPVTADVGLSMAAPG